MTPAFSHTDKHTFQKSVVFTLGFTFLLWVVKAVEWSTSTDFGVLGILPRTFTGIVGILTAPLIHGNILHLLSNTFPLFLLLLAVFYFYNKIALEVFFWIYIITGFWVWVAARQAYHIGSSGLVYGLATFLFFSGILRRDARSMAIALCIAFLYGGMLQGLIPTAGSVSWESHLLGSAAGILCSFYFRRDREEMLTQEEDKLLKKEEDSFLVTHSTFTEQYFHADPQYHYDMIERGTKQMTKYSYQVNFNTEETSTASKI